MEFSSKEIVIILLGLIGSALLSIFLESKGYFLKGFEVNDVIIILIIVLIAVLWIIYSKFNEFNRDLTNQNQFLNDFSERLKRFEDLTNIKADIIDLKRRCK